MNYSLFFGMLGGVGLISLVLGRVTHNQAKNCSDYYLSGRNVNVFSLMMTLLATQFGGGAIIGSSEAAYSYGWIALCYSSGIALGLIVLSLGVGGRFRAMNISTLPEVFELSYNSPMLRKIAGLVYIFSMFGILLAISIAMRKFLYSLGLENDLLYLLFWSVIIYYTSSGGLRAVILADTLQIVLVLTLFVIVFFSVDIRFPDITNLPVRNIESVPVLAWFLTPFCFTIIGQDMGQRCASAKSPQTVFWAALGAGILLIIATSLPVCLGDLGYVLGIEKGNGSELMQVMKLIAGPNLTALFAAGVLMALISVANALLCSISLNVAMDIPWIQKLADTRSSLITRSITTGVGLLAVMGSYIDGEIIPIMVGSYGLTVAVFFVPLLMAVFLKRVPSLAGVVSCIVGGVTFLILSFWDIGCSKELLSLVMSLAAFLSVYFIKKD